MLAFFDWRCCRHVIYGHCQPTAHSRKRRDFSRPAGRAIAVLLFQDLANHPHLLLLFPAAVPAVPDVFSIVQLVGLVILKIAVVLGIVLLAGKTVMSGWLNWVSRRGDKELFMLSLLAIIIMSARFDRIV